LSLLDAARRLLEQAEEELRRAEEAYAKQLYALSLTSSHACLELCLKASSRLLGSSWMGMGLAERAKLLEDWVVRAGRRVEEGVADRASAEVELRRAREALEALRRLIEELEEA